ncbi:hypothetical protein [Pseudoalteromonas lipolytica]
MKVISENLPQPLNNQNVTLESPKGGEALLNTELKKLADDIYHQSEPPELEQTYSKPQTMTASKIDMTKTVDDFMYELAVATGELYMPGGSVPKAVEKMLSPYDALLSDINNQAPSLAYKNWGISINQSGTLEATGSITDLEKEYLEEKLNGSEELVSAIKDFKSNYLKYIGPESRGYGRYDVTNDNFADVFDFREMLESSRSNDDFKRTWEYETNWLKLTDNILSQLKRSAARY